MLETVKRILRPARRRLMAALGRDLVLRREARPDVEVHGSDYGGFALLRDSLSSSAVVLSFGVGEDASFDLSVIGRYGCRVHAFDPTPKSVAWVRANVDEERFTLHECAVADIDGSVRLFLPQRSDFVSASLRRGRHTSSEFVEVPAKRLGTIVAELGVERIDVLKMDVEGAEYAVLADYLDGGGPLPRQLALEFHHFYPEFGIAATRDAIARLRARGYRLAWVSPSHHEVLFVR